MYSGVTELKRFQQFKRNASRGKKTRRAVNHEYTSRADLLNYVQSHALPATVGEMVPAKLYAVDKVTQYWTRFPDVLGCCLIMKRSVEWLRQLIELGHGWALHGDSKHKLHHGRWVLTTFGTHCLAWDDDAKLWRHSFRPLIYMFVRENESKSAVWMAMLCLQLVSEHFFGKPVRSAVNITDHSDGLRSGMQMLNVDPAVEHVETTPHLSDWSHISWHYTHGRILSKSHPHHGEVYVLLRALHLTHTVEMKNLLQATYCTKFASIH